ncbi:hypothetical protein ACT2FY_27295 [Paraburkholderia fungorum]|uniref:hypothetical protein n=1 Tax=Paraburkholderia fungorum TaxID=134537 RepID=UPI00402B4C63
MRKDKRCVATGADGRGIAPVRVSSTRAESRSTPQTSARKVFMLERARQQTVIRQMEAVRAEMAIIRNVLAELLSDPAFVTLLRTEGLGTMPRMLRDHLKDQLESRSP